MPRLRLMIPPAIAALATSACQSPPIDTPPPAPVPVRSEIVETRPFRASLETWGEVASDSRTELRAPRAGVLRWAPGLRSGALRGVDVTAGQEVFRIEVPDLRHERARAELEAEAARAEVDRARQGVEAQIRPEVDLENARIAARLAEQELTSLEEQTARMVVRAPSAGRLSAETRTTDGAEVSAGETLATLVAGAGGTVELWIAPERREEVGEGSPVVFRAPGQTLVVGRGRVSEVDAEVDDGGALGLRALVDEDLGLPLPGAGVDVSVVLAEVDAITVPESAIRVEAGAPSVFVLDRVGDRWEAHRVEVRVGRVGGGRREIVGGLEEGGRVVVEGAELLTEGALAVEVPAEGEVDPAAGRAAG